MHAANEFEELHREFPDRADLHYAWAAALQMAMQGATASTVLKECAEAHPGFWLAQITLRQDALYRWNPFLVPEFNPAAVSVHQAIDKYVRTCIPAATRRGVLPRAVLFLRDQADEFSPAVLQKCKMEFLTTVSGVNNPQVVAINGRIYDNPSDPYQIEAVSCPVRKGADMERFVYEMFARQDAFELVVLGSGGKVKAVRRMTPSKRMRAAHEALAQLFDRSPGVDPGASEMVAAIQRHQAITDPRRLEY